MDNWQPREAPVTVTVPAVPAQGVETPPRVVDVFVYAATQIHRAAAEIWPGVPVELQCHVPSVTGYVHRTRVGERTLYAKTSLLGVSLVSLLRGACGPWPAVLEKQREYVQQPDGLLQREAAQLRTLADLDQPRVCAVAGLAEGVIFTEPVAGPSLGDLLFVRPGDTAELLTLAFDELRPLHRAGAALRLDPAGVIGERSISGTFLRKFNGLSGATYVERVGAERRESQTCKELAELLRGSVERLRRLRMMLPAPVGTTLAYGDLKPEHVVFSDGADGRPVLLDPGLTRAAPMVDVAKLLSRTVLLLAARQPDAATARQVLDGFGTFALARTVGMSGEGRRSSLRHLLTLWLMDTLNILTTYLSAPATLPLPPLGLALVERAVPVCRLVDSVSAELVNGPARRDEWDRALGEAMAVTS
ncbi:phosphotransferase [Streptomyces sp. NPDC050164]|uniref:phosphotransferase n=1 Tax=Streptomyces sp. NPDC050164 TaxID=3365605 RepID=UPI0037A0CB3C